MAALRIPCCEVFLETYSEYSAAFGRLIKERLGSTRAVSIHSKTQHFEGDVLGQSHRQRTDALHMCEGFLQAGQVLDAHTYVYHGPANTRNRTPDFAAWQEPIQAVISLCGQYGIALSWEVVSWCYLNSPQRVLTFRGLWPELSYVLDIKQVYELGQSPYGYIDAMGDRLRHVHVLDYDADGRYVLPGKGVFDFAALGNALRASGYQGDIILEPYGNMVRDDQALTDAISYLRDAFQAE